ncbi:hypothetical protein D9757_006655 [Collybiopsis confluens]|uniref:CNNM transmembrane domain-containing protein n=1 Tax=Collybiopsis confluens TaxID=2823264 RepID=A0A8H5HN66_9AGAR|nr:hypothetical protein D9757_006655 [Collybiopsis confluens]
MPPILLPTLNRFRVAHAVFSLTAAFLSLSRGDVFTPESHSNIAKRAQDDDLPNYKKILFPILIVVLVLLSGAFAGLTLGLMSLDQTQLNVLSVSGTPKQRKYASQIKPIRKNGHLLLVTLLLANMIVNETLPIIADPVLGGGVQSVVVSTVLIVIFSEIIPQALFTRYGLYLGAKGAGLTRVLIWGLGIVSWPVAKFLDWILGENHGIIYRRVELKELIAMHSSTSAHGGDLKTDTVAIIGATLDLQEKVVSQAMTPIAKVFMVSIDAKLDYDLLKRIVETGHSRIPVYEDVDILAGISVDSELEKDDRVTQKVKKIIGILLVKQCVLLDPKDAVPVRSLQLNKVPFVPENEALLGILDKFQEGNSHMAIVSRFSVEKAKSVKKTVKQSLTRRLLERVGIETSDSDSSDTETDVTPSREQNVDKDATLRGDSSPRKELLLADNPGGAGAEILKSDAANKSVFGMSNLEANMPADAVLTMKGAKQFLQNVDPAVMPLGIITLEDVLEELIGAEIYDEFDAEGAHGETYIHQHSVPAVSSAINSEISRGGVNKSLASVKSLSFFRSRSVQPSPSLRNEGKSNSAFRGAAEEGAEYTSKADNDTASKQAFTKGGSFSTPIEAVLLDRKRRLTAASTWTPGSSESNHSSVPKGRFKSGPLKRSYSNPPELFGGSAHRTVALKSGGEDALACSSPRPGGDVKENELDLTLVKTLTEHSEDGRPPHF